MKKSKQHQSNYGISRTEQVMLSKINEEKLLVFTPKEIMRLLSWKKQKTHNILQQLKSKNIIISVKRNAYIVKEALDEGIFQAAVEAVNPSYIGFWSALSYYGFTEQQPEAIQVVTPKQYKPTRLGKYIVIPTRFKRERFFGYTHVSNFVIAEKEKCIIDSLAYPEKAGGFNEVLKCLKSAFPALNKKLFAAYLLRFNNAALNARAGYILEKLKLYRIKAPIPNAYLPLNREKEAEGVKNKKWRVIVNDSLE